MTETLHITRHFDAPRERLFDAFASADQMKHWFCPGDMTVPEAQAEFREGGRYRVAMSGEEGDFVVGGQYLKIDRPNRIEMDWKWEHGQVVSHVTLEFRDAPGGGSELELTQTGFEEASDRDAHGEGWHGSLEKLDRHVTRAAA